MSRDTKRMAEAAPALPRGSLVRRFMRYQAERFPIVSYFPLIAAFTFASAAYSRLARRAAGLPNADGFIAWPLFLVGTFTSLAMFFMLRVLDEHKDAESDARYRPELPVPRGLVSLAELRWIGGAWVALALLANAMLAPILLIPCALAAAWAFLMTHEFFVRDWLRAHMLAYLVTHMLIMPMIDGYTTGLDWLVAGMHPAPGLGWFLAVTFANGALVEVGRKLRAPADEREGVDTYTRAWGLRRATLAWLGLVAGSALLAWYAASFLGASGVAVWILAPAALLCAAPGFLFLRAPHASHARWCEIASGLWAITTYLTLGAGPFLARALGR